MDCSICLEPIKENQTTTLLRSCQHTFHEQCLTPWLQTHVSCPNCRGAIDNDQTTFYQHQREHELRELDRVYLTYSLFSWILEKFSGGDFRRHSNAIHSFVSQLRWNSIRPIAFSMTPRNKVSLSSIKALRGYCISREQTLFQQLYPDEVHRIIHRNPRMLQIRSQIRQQLDEFSLQHHS
jgi:hypothetical protein